MGNFGGFAGILWLYPAICQRVKIPLYKDDRKAAAHITYIL